MAHCTPNFIPGSMGCTMPAESAVRARLLIGDTFFRSVGTGMASNLISLTNTWQVPDGAGGERDYISGSDSICDVTRTRLDIFNNGIFVISHSVVQILDPPGSPPICVAGGAIVNGIPNLRTVLNSAASLVVMPPIDTPTTFGTIINDGPELLEFKTPVFLSGGIGIPSTLSQAALDDIRTGPFFTLTHITESEDDGNPLNDGSPIGVNETRYWNGGCWVVFDTINAPESCDAVGGSPPICP